VYEKFKNFTSFDIADVLSDCAGFREAGLSLTQPEIDATIAKKKPGNINFIITNALR
jgi:hypothetical protein|tara:strand:+ start:566 stop:736 length:171 start_codon:yes stop_codon:yes gene_type:complete